MYAMARTSSTGFRTITPRCRMWFNTVQLLWAKQHAGAARVICQTEKDVTRQLWDMQQGTRNSEAAQLMRGRSCEFDSRGHACDRRLRLIQTTCKRSSGAEANFLKSAHVSRRPTSKTFAVELTCGK